MRTQQPMHQIHQESLAAARGFEREICSKCQNMTLVREHSKLTCATCGEHIYEISKGQWLRFIGHEWPNKRSICDLLADNVGTTTRDWPPVGVGVYSRMLVEMGAKIEQAKNPEECWGAFLYVLNYCSCPEPGWEAVTLKVIP